MGGSSYSSSTFTSTIGAKTSAGIDPFAYSAKVSSGAAPKVVHETLDPSKPNKAGKVVRESRDSDAHPASTAVSVLWDVTGSMASIPRVFVEKLGVLMSLLTQKDYITDPQVLFGAIRDAYCDTVPLQLGQYESGNEMDNALTNIYLEGGGGGSSQESYELALYFMARHTELDCLEKRGKKGYLFILGDEMLYPRVSKEQVKRLIGDKIENDIPLADIIAEVQERFEVFWLFPRGSHYWDQDTTSIPLSKLFGQRFIRLEEPENVAEVIVSIIGVTEGIDVKSIGADLIAAGSSKASVKSASTAIASYVASSAVTTCKAATITGDLATTTKKTAIKRI